MIGLTEGYQALSGVARRAGESDQEGIFMRKTMLGLVLAALMTAGLGSAAWAEPAPAV